MTKRKKSGRKDVDVLVGNNLRAMRTTIGMSQGTLGESLGITFQQIQKYEKGTNRIAASTLWQLASIFNVSIETFFRGVEQLEKQETLAEPVPVLSAQAYQLALAYDNTKKPSIKKAVANLLLVLDEEGTSEAA